MDSIPLSDIPAELKDAIRNGEVKKVKDEVKTWRDWDFDLKLQNNMDTKEGDPKRFVLHYAILAGEKAEGIALWLTYHCPKLLGVCLMNSYMYKDECRGPNAAFIIGGRPLNIALALGRSALVRAMCSQVGTDTKLDTLIFDN